MKTNKKMKAGEMTVVPFLAPHPPFGGGYCNGYVAVPKNNKMWGITDYLIADEIVNAHGGVTFLERIDKNRMHWNDIEFLTKNKTIGDDWWIVGFDTLHDGDDMTNCSKEKVIEMTFDLAGQLEKLNL